MNLVQFLIGVLLTISIISFIKYKVVSKINLTIFTLAVILDLILNLYNLYHFFSFKAISFYFPDYLALVLLLVTLIKLWNFVDKSSFNSVITRKIKILIYISYIFWLIAFFLGLIATIVMTQFD